MGNTTPQFIVRKGIHTGRGHLIDNRNRQDAVMLFDGGIDGQRTIIGIVCDGCSEGTASEVGATLAAEYLVRQVKQLIEQGTKISQVPELLYPMLVDFCWLLLDNYSFVAPADRVSFIKNHLLFTVVGFVMTETDTVVFVAGDGTVVVNESVRYIDSDDHPLYPAYHLIPRSALVADASALPESFDTFVYATADIVRLAIGSDAWKDEKQFIEEIWGCDHLSALQRRINAWSAKKHFRDDVSIITVERLEATGGPS